MVNFKGGYPGQRLVAQDYITRSMGGKGICRKIQIPEDIKSLKKASAIDITINNQYDQEKRA